MASMRVFAFLLLLSTAEPVAARDLRLSDASSSDHPTARAMEFMGKAVGERTQGRITISRRAGNGQDSESFLIGQVRNGTLDMARVNLNALNVSVPGSVLPTLPFLFKSTEHMHRTLDGPVGEEILAALERQGLIGLCFHDGGTRSFYSMSKPIRSAADLRGLKVRVQKGDRSAIILQALGAEPVTMPMAHVKAALQMGVIDAAEGDWATYVTGEHHVVAPFYSLTQHSRSLSVLIFSERVWRTLSPADQRILREAARESVGHARGLIGGYEAATRRRAEAAGVRIEENVDRKSFIDAMVPLYPIVVEEARQQAAVTRIRTEQ